MNDVKKRMTQPEVMKTKAYVSGAETLNGHDVWELFKACAVGDVPKAKALLAKDRRLINAEYVYRYPIDLAVRSGCAEIVKLLLDQGAKTGGFQLHTSRERGHRSVEKVLLRAMKKTGIITRPISMN